MKVLAFITMLALAGCPDKNSPERQARAAIEKLRLFADQICACKDKACAEKVQDDLTSWSTKLAEEMGPRKRHGDEALTKELTTLAGRYGECMTARMGMAPTPAIHGSAQ